MKNTGGHAELVNSGAERLACPFQARYPEKYTKPGSCRTGLADIPKLIEHFKKHHSSKCSKCGTTFRSTDDFSIHRVGSCTLAGDEETRHLCEDKLKAVTAMPKRSPGISPRHKWESIDHVIFQDDDNMPSPFVQSLEHLRHIAQTQPPWLVESLSNALSSDMNVFLADLEKFLHIMNRGRTTKMPVATSGGSNQTSCDITLGLLEHTYETGMEAWY